ncbi:MAG: RDD family protein [Candidatus Gracilibacteria bacterium]
MHDTYHHEHIATRGERLLAIILEIIVLASIVPFKWLGDYLFGQRWTVLEMTGGDLLGVMVLLALLYLQIILVVRRSQSIGKYMLDIQVVHNKTEKRIGFWRYYLLRDIVGRTLIIGSLPILDLIFEPLYFFIDSLFIFRKDKRTLHDLIAGTKVIHLALEKRAKSFFDFSKL